MIFTDVLKMAVRKTERYLRDLVDEDVKFLKSDAVDNCFWLISDTVANNYLYKLTGNAYTDFKTTPVLAGGNFATTNATHLTKIMDHKIINDGSISDKVKKYYYKENIYYEAHRFRSNLAGTNVGGYNDLRNITTGVNHTGATLIEVLNEQHSGVNKFSAAGGALVKIGAGNFLTNLEINSLIQRHYVAYNKTTNARKLHRAGGKNAIVDFDNFASVEFSEDGIKPFYVDASDNFLFQAGRKTDNIVVVGSANNGAIMYDTSVDMTAHNYDVDLMQTSKQWFIPNTKAIYTGPANATTNADINGLDLSNIHGDMDGAISGGGRVFEHLADNTVDKSMVRQLHTFIHYFVANYATSLVKLERFIKSTDPNHLRTIIATRDMVPQRKADKETYDAWWDLVNDEKIIISDMEYNIINTVSNFHLYYSLIFLTKTAVQHTGAGGHVPLYQNINNNYANPGSLIDLEYYVKTAAFFGKNNTAPVEHIRFSAAANIAANHPNSYALLEILFKIKTNDLPVAITTTNILILNMVGSFTNNVAAGPGNAGTYGGGDLVYAGANSAAHLKTLLDTAGLFDESYSNGRYTFLFETILDIYNRVGGGEGEYYNVCLIPKSKIHFT